MQHLTTIVCLMLLVSGCAGLSARNQAYQDWYYQATPAERQAYHAAQDREQLNIYRQWLGTQRQQPTGFETNPFYPGYLQQQPTRLQTFCTSSGNTVSCF